MIAFHILNILIASFGLLYYAKRPFSWFRLGLASYSLMFFGGISLIVAMDETFGYKMPIDGLVGIVFVDAVIGLGILLGVKLAYGRMFPTTRAPKELLPPLKQASRIGLIALAAVSLASLLLFIAANGISVGNVDYEYRYDASRGWGLAILFFPAFLPLSYYLLTRADSLGRFVVVSIATLAVGALTYVALSGYRQILVGAALIITGIAFQRGYLKRWHVLPGVFLLFCTLIALSFARYAGDRGGTEFAEKWQAGFYYLQGDVFPVDAPLRIYGDSVAYGAEPGTRVALNHLGKIVPRAVWPNKPSIMLDAAGYYTQSVVGYQRGITLSPTVMGEGYLVKGRPAFYFLLLVGSVVLLWFDSLYERTRGGLPYFVGAFVYSAFFFIREGFSELLLRTIFVGVFFAFYLVIRQVVSSPVRRP